MNRLLIVAVAVVLAINVSADEKKCPQSWAQPEKHAYLGEGEQFILSMLTPSGIAVSTKVGDADARRALMLRIDGVVAATEKCIGKKLPRCAFQIHVVTEYFECGPDQVFPCAGTENEKDHRGPGGCGGCYGTYDGVEPVTLIVPPDLKRLPHLVIDVYTKDMDPASALHKKCDGVKPLA